MVYLQALENLLFNMVLKIKSSNYLLANFVAQLQLGSMRRLRYVNVCYSKISLDVLKILYKEGIIRLFVVHKKENKIMVYFKYYGGNPIFKFKLISKPSKRAYWSLRKLSLNFSNSNFVGFYIVSTPIGLITSNECLLYNHTSGEVLLKVFM